jgi:hypothetical protein
MPNTTPTKYRIRRHNGRPGDRWRVIAEGNEQQVRHTYYFLQRYLTHGAIRLCLPGGRVILSHAVINKDQPCSPTNNEKKS